MQRLRQSSILNPPAGSIIIREMLSLLETGQSLEKEVFALEHGLLEKIRHCPFKKERRNAILLPVR